MLTGARPTCCMPMLTVTRHHQCPMPPCCKAHCYKASMPLCSRLTVTRHHQRPMPPCCKAHCCKVSSVSYASLLQDPLPAYLVSVVCVIIAFILHCSGLCFIPVMVWHGLYPTAKMMQTPISVSHSSTLGGSLC